MTIPRNFGLLIARPCARVPGWRGGAAMRQDRRNADVHLSPGADSALDDCDVGGAGGDHFHQDVREPSFLRWHRR